LSVRRRERSDARSCAWEESHLVERLIAAQCPDGLVRLRGAKVSSCFSRRRACHTTSVKLRRNDACGRLRLHGHDCRMIDLHQRAEWGGEQKEIMVNTHGRSHRLKIWDFVCSATTEPLMALPACLNWEGRHFGEGTPRVSRHPASAGRSTPPAERYPSSGRARCPSSQGSLRRRRPSRP